MATKVLPPSDESLYNALVEACRTNDTSEIFDEDKWLKHVRALPEEKRFGFGIRESRFDFGDRSHVIVTCLCLAAKYAGTEVVTFLLEDMEADPLKTDDSGQTALHYACMSKIEAVKKVRYLIKRCPKLLLTASLWDTLATHVAAKFDQAECLQILLQDKVMDVNAQTERGLTPLHVAASFGSLNAIKQLLSYDNIDVNAVDEQNDTAAHHAAATAAHHAATTAAHHAAEQKHLRCVVEIAKHRAFEVVVNNQGNSLFDELPPPLTLLVHAEISTKEDLQRHFDHDHVSPVILHAACRSQREACAKVNFLLKQCDSALMRSRDENGDTPLHVAARGEDVQVISLLLANEAGQAVVNVANNQHQTALHIATMNRCHETMETLLRQPNIDVNARDDIGNTAAHYAARNADRRALHQLTNHPQYEPGIYNTDDKTMDQLHPLYAILESMNPRDAADSCLEDMLSNGRLQPTDHGNNILHVICARHDVTDLLGEFLSYDSGLNRQRNDRGDYPIHVAVTSGNRAAMMTLLERNEDDIKLTDARQNTSLHQVAVRDD